MALSPFASVAAGKAEPATLVSSLELPRQLPLWLRARISSLSCQESRSLSSRRALRGSEEEGVGVGGWEVEESLLGMGGRLGVWWGEGGGNGEMEARRSLERRRAKEGRVWGAERSPVTSTWAPMK